MDLFYAQNIPDDHPAVEFLVDLETTAYYVDKNSSGYIRRLARCIIEAILRWAYMLDLHCRMKGVAVSVSNIDLMERVCHLTNKIYREMLYITRHERMTMITIDGLNHVLVSAFSWTPQHRIVLSWDLLAWISVEGRIPCSFTTFITTPELSGPFYISLDIYHTQITEYSLNSIYESSSLFRTDWSFWEHLSRALPTEMIFFLLRSIRSECLIHRYSGELMLDILEIIIKWLEGLGSERPSDLYDRFQAELVPHKTLPQL